MVTLDEIRAYAETLPSTEVALVRDRVKFRVGRLVYVSFSRDQTLMGFAYPRDEREGLVATEPEKFLMPSKADMRYNWVMVRLDSIEEVEMREIVFDAWKFCVPKRLVAEYRAAQP